LPFRSRLVTGLRRISPPLWMPCPFRFAHHSQLCENNLELIVNRISSSLGESVVFAVSRTNHSGRLHHFRSDSNPYRSIPPHW
jgi:hypothetical protein